jgi:hypothetical protein
MSTAYEKTRNCHFEAHFGMRINLKYADKKLPYIIPIIVENNYTPDYWLADFCHRRKVLTLTDFTNNIANNNNKNKNANQNIKSNNNNYNNNNNNNSSNSSSSSSTKRSDLKKSTQEMKELIDEIINQSNIINDRIPKKQQTNNNKTDNERTCIIT